MALVPFSTRVPEHVRAAVAKLASERHPYGRPDTSAVVSEALTRGLREMGVVVDGAARPDPRQATLPLDPIIYGGPPPEEMERLRKLTNRASSLLDVCAKCKKPIGEHDGKKCPKPSKVVAASTVRKPAARTLRAKPKAGKKGGGK